MSSSKNMTESEFTPIPEKYKILRVFTPMSTITHRPNHLSQIRILSDADQ